MYTLDDIPNGYIHIVKCRHAQIGQHPQWRNKYISNPDSLQKRTRGKQSRSKNKTHAESYHCTQRGEETETSKTLNTRSFKPSSAPLTQPGSPRQSRDVLELETRLIPKAGLLIQKHIVEVSAA